MFRIKICGITNIEDARAAVDAGAEAIGLNFFRSSRRYVVPEIAQQIAADVSTGVAKVGVFVNHDAQQIAEIADRVGLDFIQLHGDERPALLAQLPTHIPVIRAHRCGSERLAPLAKYLTECRDRLPDAVLVDAAAGAEYGGTGKLVDWLRLDEERAELAGLPLILAGGLTPDNVASAIAAVRPDGVDVASGVERAPGRKDPKLVAKFIATARAAFARI